MPDGQALSQEALRDVPEVQAMMLHFLIVQLGSADLLALALDSIRTYAPASMVDIVPLPADTCDPRAHGQAIDQWRITYEGQVRDDDVVVLMDPDVVLLSHQWRVELERAFADARVGVWGAGAREDFGPRVHASMMAIRGKVWNTHAYATFVPLRDPCGPWRDTGGHFCHEATLDEWRVQPLERGPDWHGYSAWWGIALIPGSLEIGLPVWQPVPLWAHLGGGSHSDVTRMTRWQRLARWRSVQHRKRFISAARSHLERA